MKTRPWFKCYPADFLNGVADLDPYQITLYTVILMRIYDEDRAIPHNVTHLARRCNMRKRTCERALNSLIDIGKLSSDGEFISNGRATDELTTRRESAGITREKRGNNAGITREFARDVSKKPNEINKTPKKQAKKQALRARDPEARKKESKKPPPCGDPPTAETAKDRGQHDQRKTARGSRIKETWRPDDKTRRKCEALTDSKFVEDQIERFLGHWLDATGKGATKRAWDRAFVNWIKQAVDWGNYRPSGGKARNRPGNRSTVAQGVAAILGPRDEDRLSVQQSAEASGKIIEG